MNKTAERMRGITDEINKRHDEKNNGSDWIQRLGMNSKEYQDYIEDFNDTYSRVYTEELVKMFGERPI